MKLGAAFWAVILGTASLAHAQPAPPLGRGGWPPTSHLDRSRTAAAGALASIPQLVADGASPKDLGFRSQAEIAQARLGIPIPESRVSLADLEGYAPGTAPRTLLKPTGRLIYPILVGEAARSSVIVAERGNRWSVVAIGFAPTAEALQRVRARAAAGPPTHDVHDYALIDVPALSMKFLGRLEGTGVELIPLFDVPRYGFKSGKRTAAPAAFQKMKAAALDRGGDPG